MCAGLGALPCPGSDATSLSVVPVSGWTALVRWCPAVQLPEEQWVGPGSPSFLCSEKVAVRWGGAPRGALCLGGRVPAAGSGASLLGGGTHAWTVESGASLPSAQWLCLWVWFQAALLPGAFGSQVSLGSLTVPPCALGVLGIGPSCQPPLLPLWVRACMSLLGERATRLVLSSPQQWGGFSELSRCAGVPWALHAAFGVGRMLEEASVVV